MKKNWMPKVFDWYMLLDSMYIECKNCDEQFQYLPDEIPSACPSCKINGVCACGEISDDILLHQQEKCKLIAEYRSE